MMKALSIIGLFLTSLLTAIIHIAGICMIGVGIVHLILFNFIASLCLLAIGSLLVYVSLVIIGFVQDVVRRNI